MNRATIPVLSVAFVLLWASGFIVAKLSTATTDVPTVLLWRFVIAAAVTGAAAAVLRPGLPDRRSLGHLVVTALLLQVGVFSAVFTGVSRGVPAGLTSLIVGMAPLLVGLLTPLVLRTRLGAAPVVGLLLGACGVYIVVSGDLAAGVTGPVLLPVLGMLFLTAGTLYQKRFNDDTPISLSVVVQMVTSGLAVLVAMPFLDTHWLPADGGSWLAVVWLGVLNSAGTFVVMFVLLRRRSTLHVSALLNLSPATTALIAVPVLGEELTVRAVIGLAVALVGMYVGLGLVRRRRRRTPEPAPAAAAGANHPD